MENKIKEARKATGKTQADICRKLEIPRRTLEDWEAGRRSPAPWMEKLLLEKLAEMAHESLLHRLLSNAERTVSARYIPEDYDPFSGTIEPVEIPDMDKYYWEIQQEAERYGVYDTDYEVCPHDVNPDFLINVKEGREVKKIS